MSLQDFGKNALNIIKKPAAILGLTAMSILGAGSMNDVKSQNIGKRTGTDTTQTDNSASSSAEDAPRSYKVEKPKPVVKPQRDVWMGGVGASLVPDFGSNPTALTPRLYWYGMTPGFVGNQDGKALSPHLFGRAYVSLAGKPIGGSANYRGYGVSSYTGWSLQGAVSGADLIGASKAELNKDGTSFCMMGLMVGARFFGYQGNEFNSDFNAGAMALASFKLASLGDRSCVNFTAGIDYRPVLLKDRGAYRDFLQNYLVGKEERNPVVQAHATIGLTF